MIVQRNTLPLSQLDGCSYAPPLSAHFELCAAAGAMDVT